VRRISRGRRKEDGANDSRWLSEAQGELVWDVERCTLRTLSVEAVARSTVVTVRELEGIEGEPTYEQTMRLVGRSKLTCDVR
jgi:hypothetical protein